MSYINTNEEELRPLSDQSCSSTLFRLISYNQPVILLEKKKRVTSMTDQITVSTAILQCCGAVVLRYCSAAVLQCCDVAVLLYCSATVSTLICLN